MVEAGQQADFPEEPLGGDADCQLGMQHLEGDPVPGLVGGQEYPAGAAAGQLAFDVIAVRQGLLNHGEKIAADAGTPMC